MTPVPPRFRRGITLAATGLLALESVRRGLVSGSFAESFPMGVAAWSAFLLPTLFRNCPWNGPVTRTFKTQAREVWLTIDDGPDPADTPEILEVLGNHQATATFFAIGRRVEEHPDLAAAVTRAGHPMQSHTYSHPSASFWAAGPARVRQELGDGIRVIRESTGIQPTQFRSPAGLSNPFVHARVSQLGLQMVGWSVAGFDGVPHSPDAVVQRVLAGIRPGAILLLHEGPALGMKPGTRARTLARILAGLDSAGYRTVIPALGNAAALHGEVGKPPLEMGFDLRRKR
ncbi:MAG: hypothetical protein RLZZ253_785 [Verrucomicrobiota bacterium]